MKLTTVWCQVDDMKRAVEFYERIVGLKKEYASDEWTQFDTGSGVALGLHPRIHGESGSTGHNFTVSFSVDSLDREIARLKGLGVKVHGGGIESPGMRLASFVDPDHNEVNVTQTYPMETEAFVQDVDPIAENERQDLIFALQENLRALKEVCDPLTKEQWAKPYAPGKWPAAGYMQHLADMETMAYAPRMKRLADTAESWPRFENVDQEAVALAKDYHHVSGESALAEFEMARTRTLKLLNAAPAEVWNRRGAHPQHGTISIAEMVRMIRNHDTTHLGHIQQCAAAWRMAD